MIARTRREDVRTIDDAALFRALEWIKDNAEKIAEARAKRLYMDEWLPALRARLANEFIQKEGDSAAAADIKAKASDTYATALKGYEAAVYEDERLRILRVQAEAVTDIWRTFSANKRATEKVT